MSRRTKKTPTPKRPRRTPRARPRRPAPKSGATRRGVAATPVSAADLRALRRDVTKRAAPLRWNPDPEDVQRSVAQLVLTLVELLRQLMERQAIRRLEQKTLTKRQAEDVGAALMRLEETVRDIGARFGLGPEDLNLDLGPIKLM